MEPFLGEIRLFAGDYPPPGWAFCDGQQLPIIMNQALYSLLGATYGGDGRTYFCLPDLRGRVPIHAGAGIRAGAVGGEESHALTSQEMPAHQHQAFGTNAPATAQIADNIRWANNGTTKLYYDSANTVMHGQALTVSGQGQAHPNMQPYTVLNYCICMRGIFPPRDS